jgi:hypothetical protein
MFTVYAQLQDKQVLVTHMALTAGRQHNTNVVSTVADVCISMAEYLYLFIYL